MHSLSGQHCQPPCKSHIANHILFGKESNFCMAFVSATSQLTWESVHEMHFILQYLEQIFVFRISICMHIYLYIYLHIKILYNNLLIKHLIQLQHLLI